MTIKTNTQQVNNNPPLYAMGQTAVEQPNQQVGSTLQTPADGSNNYVYNYPTTSIYKKPDSGVTIQIFNPSAIGAPNSTSVASANYPQPYFPSIPLPVINQPNTNTNINNNQPQASQPQQEQPAAAAPLASTPVNTEDTKEKKKKNVVELTDTYIKTLENYLKSPDKSIRKNGIVDLIKRFQEDPTRHNDPALTALLNISLKDPDPANRMLSMSAIAGELASGDETTIRLLENLQKSDKMYGQEAKMAADSLLKVAQTKTTIDAE